MRDKEENRGQSEELTGMYREKECGIDEGHRGREIRQRHQFFFSFLRALLFSSFHGTLRYSGRRLLLIRRSE